jgi:ketosteroid isomerase-like protein
MSPRRSLEERFALRFPRVLALGAWLFMRLPPQSRLRRVVVGRAARRTFEASNRRDYAVAFALYHPKGESVLPSAVLSLGIDAHTRGRAERERVQREWDDQWGDPRFDLREVVDLGDRIVLLGRFKASGPSSGIGVDRAGGFVITLVRGLAIHEQVFFDDQAALAAAGLPPCNARAMAD